MSEDAGNKIILIEGKRLAYQTIFFKLKRRGFKVALAVNGATALRMMAESRVSFVILNAASFPTNCKRILLSIKRNYPSVPILLIVAEGENVSARNTIADYVIAYPFTVLKVVNRIRAVTEAAMIKTEGTDGVVVDLERRLVHAHGKNTKLTQKTCSILRLLIERQGEEVSRRDIIRAAWSNKEIVDQRSLDVHIRWLREAIEPLPNNPEYIKTVRGSGYILEKPLTVHGEREATEKTDVPAESVGTENA